MPDPQIKAAPIRKSLLIKASRERAFSTFVASMGRWWPRTHHIGAVSMADVVIEPRIDGRWYELGEDGSQCLWGKVLAWDAPTRLVLAWQINADWKYDAGLVTEVEVSFIEVGAAETRVEFEHRNLERLGERAQAIRALLNSGWPGILDLFQQSAMQP